jgi:hypothetical protein
MKFSDWLRGGVRYKRLQRSVERAVRGEELETYFIGIEGKVSKLFAVNPMSLFRTEFAIALTPKWVTVLRVTRPAVFGSSVKRTEYRVRRGDLSWDGKKLSTGKHAFTPFPFHRLDAQELYRRAIG